MAKESFYINVGESTYGADELVPIRTASKISGLSPRQIQRLYRSGIIPYYRFSSNTVRFCVRDLIIFTEDKREEF